MFRLKKGALVALFFISKMIKAPLFGVRELKGGWGDFYGKQFF